MWEVKALRQRCILSEIFLNVSVSMSSYILSLDAGTSSLRAFIYNLDGVVKASASCEFEHYYPNADWVEFDGELLWQKTLRVINTVISESKIDRNDLLSFAITNQRESVLMWNKSDGRLLGPAISWQDRRTESFCMTFSRHEKRIQQKTGLLPSAYFSASKINWMLNHYPLAKNLRDKEQLLVGTVDCFLIWRLTGGANHVTDVTNASRTLLMNIDTGDWDEELLSLFSVTPSMLPQILDSDGQFGKIDKKIFGVEVPITGVLGDQQAALFGHCCFEQGMTKVTYGTGGFLLMNAGQNRPAPVKGILTTIAYQVGGQRYYAQEGCMYSAGSILSWIKNNLNLIGEYREIDLLISQLENNGGVYLIPAFTGLASPYWEHHMKAAFFGLALDSDKRHLVRAAIESIVYQTKDILDSIEKESDLKPKALAIDGGLVKSQFMVNYLSACMGRTLFISHLDEMTVFGAFLMATKGLGINSLSELGKFQEHATKIDSDEPQAKPLQAYQAWQGYLNQLRQH